MTRKSSYDKPFKELRRRLASIGWRVLRTRQGHYMCYSPDGKSIVTIAGSDEHHAYLNVITRLRRAGADL